MLALNNLSKYENEKTTKILKPWLNVFNDYLVILLLTVPIFVGGMELTSGRYVCVPAVHCSMSNNASTLLSKIKFHNVCRAVYSSQKTTDTKGKAITVVTKLQYARDYDYVNSECEKTAFPWFHSYFSLLLFGQAFILLLMNNLWLKYPWASSTVNTFYALAEECYNLPGAHFARLTLKKDQKSKTKGSERNKSERIQLYAQAEDSVSVGVDLSTAVAVKTLYEKIGRFNDYARTSKQIQYVYLIQAVLQILLTVIYFGIDVGLKNIKGTAKCSVDEYFIPVTYDYFTCSHNLSTLLERALEVFLCILSALFIVCISIVSWTIYKVFWMKTYSFKDQLKGWKMPSDLCGEPAVGDMGFLLHLLHAYDVLYSVQFAIYLSEEQYRKFKTVIRDHEWPVEKLKKHHCNRTRQLFLSGLSGIPNALFQLDEHTIARLSVLGLNGCGPLHSHDFKQFKKFRNLSTLSLVHCGLTEIPKALFQLEFLETLDLNNNSIEQIPSEISSFKTLLNFDISDNEVKTIGSSIQTLPLEIIDISNNPDMEVSAVINVLKCNCLQQLAVSDSSSILESLREEDEQLKEKFQRVARQVEH